MGEHVLRHLATKKLEHVEVEAHELVPECRLVKQAVLYYITDSTMRRMQHKLQAVPM